MGLKDWKRDAIEKAALWWLADWSRRARAGEKGPEMQKLMQWTLENRGPLGWMVNFVATVVAGGHVGHVPGFGSEYALTVAFVLGQVGTALVGAGTFKSDQYHRDRRPVGIAEQSEDR